MTNVHQPSERSVTNAMQIEQNRRLVRKVCLLHMPHCDFSSASVAESELWDCCLFISLNRICTLEKPGNERC